MNRFIVWGYCILLSLGVSGCGLVVAGAAGGAGTAFWLSRKITDQVPVSYDEAIEAAKKGIESLDMEVAKETRSDVVTQIISRYPDGSRVWIDLRPVGENATKIEIRVGAAGDREASIKILERIKGYL